MWLKLLAGMILFGLIAPILVIIPLSFSSSSFFQFPPSGYSLKWYGVFLDNQEWISAFIRSLYTACLTALLATVLGTMAATAVTRINFWGKKAFMAVMVAPMVVPVIIVAIALYYTFAPMHVTNTLGGLVLAHSVLAVPIVFVTVTTGLKGIDRRLELASMGLGSTPLGTFFKVTFPLIRPSILSGALFALITSLDEVVVTIFIAGEKTKTLPVVMWENLRTQIDPTIAVVSTILIAGTVMIFFVQSWIRYRVSKF
ncbi:ABC transporter permease [Brevibacillus sp. NRS-1366]|uniref:ABC transporter permease n=1 Tax=Brevibacillus sp. NRS-1366 TaxID=3233899 RepID=UPI003D248057